MLQCNNYRCPQEEIQQDASRDVRQRGQEEGHGCRLAAKLITFEERMLILAAILLKLEENS